MTSLLYCCLDDEIKMHITHSGKWSGIFEPPCNKVVTVQGLLCPLVITRS